MRYLIKSLKNSNSECLDGISNQMVKISIDSLVLPMTYLWNKCVEKETFPTIWKFFKVLGLYKSKGAKEDPKFYRPISILSPLSKVIEKEMLSQMVAYMDKNKLWSKNIYAYRKNHNTTNALIDLVEIWMDNINNNQQNISMFLDLSAAFDCVSHSILKSKLSIYGFSENANNLIMSYLTDRKQCVSVAGVNSEFLSIDTGVPQGSIVGPFFYNLYIQELPHFLDLECEHKIKQINLTEFLFDDPCEKCGIILTFADDSSLTIKTTKKENISAAKKLDTILSKLENFLKLNNLKLNIDKTELIRITTSQQLTANGQESLKLQAKNSKGENITPSKTAKILGITFQSNLNWSSHFEKSKEAIINKCKKKLGALKFVAKFASINSKKKLANGCIMSRLTYGIQVWGLNINKTPLKKIQRVQNITMCWVLSKPFWTKTSELLNEMNWLSIYQLACYHSILLLWKVNIHKAPLNNLKNIEMSRNMRGRLKKTRRIWSIRSLELFDELPLEIKQCQKISKFKKLLKKWIGTNIPIEE